MKNTISLYTPFITIKTLLFSQPWWIDTTSRFFVCDIIRKNNKINAWLFFVIAFSVFHYLYVSIRLKKKDVTCEKRVKIMKIIRPVKLRVRERERFSFMLYSIHTTAATPTFRYHMFWFSHSKGSCFVSKVMTFKIDSKFSDGQIVSWLIS